MNDWLVFFFRDISHPKKVGSVMAALGTSHLQPRFRVWGGITIKRSSTHAYATTRRRQLGLDTVPTCVVCSVVDSRKVTAS